MEILNVGPLELIIILVIMFIVLGPRDMVLTAYRVGRWFRGLVRSPMWREILAYSQEIRQLPKKLMDETGLEEAVKEVKKSTSEATAEINAALKEVSDAAREPTAEINASLKEVSDAARVPEAEHLALNTSGADAAALDEAKASISSVLGTNNNASPASAVLVTADLAGGAPAAGSIPPALMPRSSRSLGTSAPDEGKNPYAAGNTAGASTEPEPLPGSNGHFAGSETAALPTSFAPRRSRASSLPVETAAADMSAASGPASAVQPAVLDSTFSDQPYNASTQGELSDPVHPGNSSDPHDS